MRRERDLDVVAVDAQAKVYVVHPWSHPPGVQGRRVFDGPDVVSWEGPTGASGAAGILLRPGRGGRTIGRRRRTSRRMGMPSGARAAGATPRTGPSSRRYNSLDMTRAGRRLDMMRDAYRKRSAPGLNPPAVPETVEQLREGDRYELTRGRAVYVAPTGLDGALRVFAGGAVINSDPQVKAAAVDPGCVLADKTLRAPDIAVGDLPDTPGWMKGAPALAGGICRQRAGRSRTAAQDQRVTRRRYALRVGGTPARHPARGGVRARKADARGVRWRRARGARCLAEPHPGPGHVRSRARPQAHPAQPPPARWISRSRCRSRGRAPERAGGRTPERAGGRTRGSARCPAEPLALKGDRSRTRRGRSHFVVL